MFELFNSLNIMDDETIHLHIQHKILTHYFIVVNVQCTRPISKKKEERMIKSLFFFN